jgi:hypothetical protein
VAFPLLRGVPRLETRVALVVAPRNCLHATISWTDPAEFHGTTSHPGNVEVSFLERLRSYTCHGMVDGSIVDQVERWSSSSGYETSKGFLTPRRQWEGHHPGITSFPVLTKSAWSSTIERGVEPNTVSSVPNTSHKGGHDLPPLKLS